MGCSHAPPEVWQAEAPTQGKVLYRPAVYSKKAVVSSQVRFISCSRVCTYFQLRALLCPGNAAKDRADLSLCGANRKTPLFLHAIPQGIHQFYHCPSILLAISQQIFAQLLGFLFR